MYWSLNTFLFFLFIEFLGSSCNKEKKETSEGQGMGPLTLLVVVFVGVYILACIKVNPPLA